MVSLISPPSSSSNVQLHETRFFSTLFIPPRYYSHSLIIYPFSLTFYLSIFGFKIVPTYIGAFNFSTTHETTKITNGKRYGAALPAPPRLLRRRWWRSLTNSSTTWSSPFARATEATARCWITERRTSRSRVKRRRKGKARSRETSMARSYSLREGTEGTWWSTPTRV